MRTLARPRKVLNAVLWASSCQRPWGDTEGPEGLWAECWGLTWEGLQALQDGGHGYLLLQGGVAEVLVVQEAEQPRELGQQLLQHCGGNTATALRPGSRDPALLPPLAARGPGDRGWGWVQQGDLRGLHTAVPVLAALGRALLS